MSSTTAVPTDRAAILRQLITASITGDAAAVGELVTDDVVGWSPALSVTSRQELLDEFEQRHDSFSNLKVQVDTIDLVSSKAIAEWRLSADFTAPLQVGDTTVPPTGDRIHLVGATFAGFTDGRIRYFRHYFDDAALLEQLLGLM